MTAAARDIGAEASSVTRLNWGCGDHVAAGWINSDAKPDPHVDLVADIRQGLPLRAGSVDYAVSVHALPELAYPELVPALEELRRVLKPNGVLRLVLPDFDRAIDAYREGRVDYFDVPEEAARSAGGRFIVHSLWFGYTRSLFTREFAAELLERAGFDRVQVCEHRRTSGPFGSIVELDNRPEESLCIEGRRPRPIRTHHRRARARQAAADGELEIVTVARDPGQGVKAHFAAQAASGRAVAIVGWVIGARARTAAVEIDADGALAASADVDLPRPDVAEAYPDEAAAARCGFHLELRADGRGESQLELFAKLDDGSREPLGRILVGCAESAPGSAGGIVVPLAGGGARRAHAG